MKTPFSLSLPAKSWTATVRAYFTATIQSHIDYLEKEREKTQAKTWEEEQKRRRASLEEQMTRRR